MRFLFYMAAAEPAETVTLRALPDRYRCVLWKPTLRSLVPPGLKWWPHGRRTLFHYLRIYASSEYRVLMIYDGDKPVHRSFISPRWFRFPFMGRNDLQIVSTWTEPEYRGQGLATIALSRIMATFAGTHRLWYVVAKENVSSIRVVEKCGFTLVGRGSRASRLGSRWLGSFQIREWTTAFAAFCDWIT